MEIYLKNMLNQTLQDEDGNGLKVITNKGLSSEEIDLYEAKNGIKLPRDFREVFEFSNGLHFFGEEILAIQEQQIISNESLLSFHSWGNGDFDAIVVESNIREKHPLRQVVFVCHETGQIVPIAADIKTWIKHVYHEVRTRGVLMHPDDYEIAALRETNSSLFYKFIKKNPLKKNKSENSHKIQTGLYANVRKHIQAFEDGSKAGTEIKTKYFSNGNKASEEVYRNGKLNGIVRYWHENGRICNEIEFVEGVLCGRNTIWDEKGNLIAEGYFLKGVPWDGNFKSEDENGVEYVEKYKDGKMIQKQGFSKHEG